jgi:hypothetical protein
MRRYIVRTLTLVSLLYVAPISVAHAALQRVGPVNPTFGYPSWYQDQSGLTLDFCSPNQSELDGGWCLLLPPAPIATAPEVFPTNFSNEHFYWQVGSGGRRTGALLTMSMEAAFRSGPVVPGDQMTFGRIRVVIPSLPLSGTYTIYHPFGVWTFPNLVAGDRLFYTEDVGFNCALGQFDCALATSIGPYLLPSVTPGGAQLPPIPLLPAGVDPFNDAIAAPAPYPGNLATATPKYLAHPARIGPITGSPLADLISAVDGLPYNHNRFRIEVVPPGGVPTLVDDSDLFNVQGRIFEGAIPGTVTVQRASYTAPVGTALKLDVFATATPGMQARVPPAATATLLSAVPILQFYDDPCTLDPVTLLPIGPPATPPHQMFADAARNTYWGQSPPAAIPLSVCVEQTNAPAAGGGTASSFYSKTVEDEVTVSQGLFDPSTTTLAVNAASSNLATPPALNLVDFGPLTAGAFTGTAIPPPATLTVVSSAGGVVAYQTNTALGVAAAATVPVAVNDAVTMFEDCSPLPATACATPQVISPIANDTLAGAPIVFGPGVTVAIISAPRLGTAVVDPLTGNISYTPNANASGVDGIAYTVSVTDAAGVVHTSNLANVAITITPVNDAPVAVNDTGGAVVNKAITISVLANDTDPDGAADIVAVANLTQPVGPIGAIASTAVVGAAVTFTANTAGTYTFTYRAQDKAGALSLLPATVTVTVAAAETLTITPPALFTVASSRWKIAGTDTPPFGQVVRIQYANGPNAGFIIADVPVDALGNWLLDIRGVSGLFNPTTAAATQIMVSSFINGNSTGAIQFAPITVK